MRKHALWIGLFWLLSLGRSHAQPIVDGKDLSQLNGAYIELTCYYKSKTEVSVRVDYGEGYSPSQSHDFLKPQKGQPDRAFTSFAEVLNYFYDNGWVLRQALAMASGPRVYVLQRRGL